MGKCILGFGLILIVLLILTHGGLGVIFGLVGGAVGLVMGVVGAAFGIVAGLFGALVGVAATLFALALPLVIIVLLVAGVVRLFKLV